MSSYAIQLTDDGSGNFSAAIKRSGTVSGGTTVNHAGHNDLTTISSKDHRRVLEAVIQIVINDRAAGN